MTFIFFRIQFQRSADLKRDEQKKNNFFEKCKDFSKNTKYFDLQSSMSGKPWSIFFALLR